VAVAESAIAGGLSAVIDLANPQEQHLTVLLFGEGPSRIVVSVAPENVAVWEAYLASQEVPVQKIGTVAAADQDFTIKVAGETLINAPLQQLIDTYNQAIPRRMV